MGAVAEGRAAQPIVPSVVGAAEAPEPQVRGVVALTTIVVALTTGCVTREEVKLRLRVQELEQFMAGAQDDNAMLQRALIEQAEYIYQLERGAMWQANEMARIVDTCEL